MNKRINHILELLTASQKVDVVTLSKTLGVSQVTIRKDLDHLEKQGIITREHGYALLASKDDINARIAYHYEEKRKIALRASELVQDGDTIMIESGSCCALLAEILSETRQDITLITNSAFILNYIRHKTQFQCILLGGIYQSDAQVNVGPMIAQCAKNFLVDHFFIGTDGYSSIGGFTNRDQMRAQAVRDMAESASEVIILTESEKFATHGVVPLNLGNKITTVITDQNISHEMRQELMNTSISPIIVE